MRIYFTLLFILFVNYIILAQAPTINSFSPVSGPVGTIVTITGNNFSTTPSDNIVFFGAVKATVTTAASSSLTVAVPTGATFQPITVTVNGLTAFSAQPFNLTFAGGGNGFKASSFASKIDYVAGNGPVCVVSGDVDIDGQPDLIAVNVTSKTVSVYRNVSSNGTIVLSAKVDFLTGNSPYSVAVGDLDGDGKPDLAVANGASNTVSIFRNTSAGAGDISFATKIDLSSGTYPFCVVMGDFDGDGKPDLASANRSSNTVSIFKNNSTVGAFSFLSKVDFVTGTTPYWLAVGDLDNDGKSELAVANGAASNSVSVLRNTSTTGSISFATKIDFDGGIESYGIATGDIDGDGKLDLAIANGGSESAILLNKSNSSGNISFTQKLTFNTGNGSYGSSLGDIDGDGKPDIIIANSTSNTVSVLKNRSIPGFLMLDTKADMVVGTNPWVSAIVDLDGDGKPDISTANYQSANISVLKNAVAELGIQSFTPASAGSGMSVTINGSNFTGITGVSFGGLPAAAYNVLSSTAISAVIGTGASGNVTVTTNSATASIAGFTYLPAPVISSISKIIAGTGDTIIITGINLINITGVSFGGIQASSFTVNPPTKLMAVVGSGASGNVAVTSTGGTGIFGGFTYIPPPAISSFTPSNADTGLTVTITGNNFAGATSVKFGEFDARSFNIVSSNSITAIVEAFTGGAVSVTTPYGVGKLGGFYNGLSITSFAPTSGPVGTIVTITGNNFDNNPSKNIVFFGAVRAVVTSASNHTLTAVVPPGTTYQPISVVCNQLVTFSDKPFVQTFLNNDTSFIANSFAGKIDFKSQKDPFCIAVNDLDGDGRVEVIVSSTYAISVFRNASTKGVMSFSKVDLPVTGSRNVSIGDINGDGRSDIIISNSSEEITVIRNNSNSGFLTLLAPIEFTLAVPSYYYRAFKDIDGDGKVDLIGINEGNNTVLIYRNTTANGVISFGPAIIYPTGVQPLASYMGDLDGDKKPDLVVANFNSGKVSVYRNVSASGTILFDFPHDVNAPGGLGDISLGDMDGDGKPDIIVSNKVDTSILIFRNLSTTNTISFAQPKRLLAGINIYDLSVQDLDGDGKPDIAGVSIISNEVCVLKNNSVIGNISFATTVNYVTGKSPTSIACADFDGDGKADMVVSNFHSDSISFYRNSIGETKPVILCPPSANTTITSAITGINYQWQLNTGNGYTNISNDLNHTGAYLAALQINNIPSAWAVYKYRCVVDGISGEVFELRFSDSWNGTVSSEWENPANWSCGTVPDTNTDVVINSGIIVINSNITIRSLTINPGATITVNPGFNLKILH